MTVIPIAPTHARPDHGDALGDVLAAYARLGYLASGCESARRVAAYSRVGIEWLFEAEVALSEARVALGSIMGVAFTSSRSAEIVAYEELVRHLAIELDVVRTWLDRAASPEGDLWTTVQRRHLDDARTAVEHAAEALARIAEHRGCGPVDAPWPHGTASVEPASA